MSDDRDERGRRSGDRREARAAAGGNEPARLDDRQARARIVGEPERSAIVEAAAGTGKTTILVQRLVEVLASERAAIENVVAVTFTRKAAGELKLRLRQALDRERATAADARRRAALTDALARLEEASVGTIHSFCAEILRERPVEAGIDPEFAEIDQEQADELFGRAFRRWIERTLEDPPEGVARALGRLAARPSFDGSSPLDRLHTAARQLRDWRDYPAPWSRRPFERDAEIDALVRGVRELAALYDGNPDTRDPLRQALAPAWRLAEWVRRSEAVSERDHDALEAQLLSLARELRRQAKRKGRGPWPVEGLSRAEVARRRDALLERLEAFRVAADADLAALLREELAGVLEEYERLKRRAGQLDFLDLLVRARDLIRDDAAVRHHLQRKISHLFVDEFQDTDPLQVEILLLLAADDPSESDWRRVRPVPGKLFLVGDPKQSIYRFRRADVVLYEQVKRQLVAAGVDLHVLSRSWRSVRPLQATINAAFAPEMVQDAQVGQPQYVPLQRHRPAIEGQPAVVALPVPRPYSQWGRITARQIDEQQPELVAAFLEWLFQESGWVVHDPDSKQLVPVQPRHVALLFRRFLSWGRDVTRPYLAALETRGIPHLLAGGRSFHQREEVETLRAAATAIEWPDDELSVYATLKGSLFAIADAALLRYREEIGRLHPFRPEVALDEELRPVGEALDLLAHLHRRRNRVPATDVLRELLERTRAHAGFAMRPAGHQVLANVQRVLDLARAFELRGGLSFRGFVQRLADEAERPGATETPLIEEDAEGVRLLTVHGAKGLEFPVVLLADITASLARDEPSTAIDPARRLCAMRLLGCAPWELVERAELERQRDRAEGVRLAYVAATRARDLLVVPALGEWPWEDGWVSPLNRALYPPRERYRRSEPAPGCPRFGEATVLERPHRAPGEMEPSVRPGLHVSEAGEPVVWWDPSLLRLGLEPNFGLRQEELLSEPAGDELPGAELWSSWQQRHAAARERGSRPSLTVTLASRADRAPPEFERPVQVVRVPPPAAAPAAAGTRFGTLVHAVLRDVDYRADAAAVQAVARWHGRVLGADDVEVHAASARVAAALAHPLLAAAAAAARRYREVPFLLPAADGAVMDGVIDLVYEGPEGWTIVDFKTDAAADDDALLERYAPQGLWYAAAVERLLGGRARVVLLSL